LFFLDSGHPPAADSGMTDLALALNSLVFQQPASDPACHLGFFCLLSAASCPPTPDFSLYALCPMPLSFGHLAKSGIHQGIVVSGFRISASGGFRNDESGARTTDHGQLTKSPPIPVSPFLPISASSRCA